MKLTKSKLKEIIKEELLNEKTDQDTYSDIMSDYKKSLKTLSDIGKRLHKAGQSDKSISNLERKFHQNLGALNSTYKMLIGFNRKS